MEASPPPSLVVRNATYVVLAIGALCVSVVMLVSAWPNDANWSVAMLGFLLWAVAPSLIAGVAARRSRTPLMQRATLVVSVLITGLALVVYPYGVLVMVDAQSGLLFLFIPIYQLLATALVLGACGVFGIIRRRLARRSVV